MTQLCLWTKIRTKQWLILVALAFQCMRAGFLCPKCDNFACLHTRQDQNELKSAYRWSRSQAHLAKQSSSVYTTIKLIICQIRHALSVTIHEISTSWKKTLDGGPYINFTQSNSSKKLLNRIIAKSQRYRHLKNMAVM